MLDLQSTVPNLAIAWSRTVSTVDFRMSWISIAAAFHRVDREADPTIRAAVEVSLRSFLAKMRADGGEPYAFNEAHADAWRFLLSLPGLRGLAATSRQVYAIAMAEGLTVVEESNGFTATLRAQGCLIETV